LTEDIILALDFGGTKRAAGITRVGSYGWESIRSLAVPPGADASTDLRLMYTLAGELLDGRTPAAVGVSFGGPVDFEAGLVRLSHHVPGWESTQLRQILSENFNAPAAVDNDANSATLGEYRLGAGRDCRSMIYITVSTGVGAGWVLDGRVWRGRDSMAGEIGHTSLDPNGPICLCGKRGCLERYASGPYIVEDVRRELSDEPDQGQVLRSLAEGDINSLNARIVAEAAAAGDSLASARLRQAAWALGTAIGNCANLMNPDRFVLGGGVTGAGDAFWAEIRKQARRTSLPQVNFEIRPASLGGQSPLWGAVLLAEELLR
jgi:glucokinase